MKEIVADPNFVAYCGLYCGACRSYLKGRCPGCHDNERAKWCKLRSCCIGKGYQTCADCTEYPDPGDCKNFNNIMSRIFGLIFRSDRRACISRIRETGVQAYANYMADLGFQSMKR